MLLTVLILLVGIVAAVLPSTFSTASSSQAGEQAVSQANSGVSDALFRLDQMGDSISGFCVGTPPASVLPAGLTASSCMVEGTTALTSAPGLQYYLGSPVTTGLPAGVTNEVQLVSHAVVSGQARTVHVVIYRVADTFGIFGVAGVNANGALKKANVYEVGGYPVTGPLQGGTVDIGVGPNGNSTCTGNSGGTAIVTIGENGAKDSACPNWQSEAANFDPTDPTICTTGQVSSAFSPCVDTSSFATSGGQDYCPLPGTGIPNPLLLTAPFATPLATPPPQSGAVFDCATNGAAVTIGENPGAPSLGCAAGVAALPFGLTSIPAGTYYFDSNAVTVGNLDPCLLPSQVSIFVLPTGCASNACPQYVPTSTSNQVMSSNSCTLPPSANTNVSLTLAGNDINAGPAPQLPFDFTPGNPANFNLYWSGNNAVSVQKGLVFDGNLYAPGSILVMDGNGYETFGSLILGCFSQKGSPNLYFVYPQHPRQFLQGWTQTAYRITP